MPDCALDANGRALRDAAFYGVCPGLEGEVSVGVLREVGADFRPELVDLGFGQVNERVLAIAVVLAQ